MHKVIDRAVFWEFKARCAELDLEAARVRAQLHAVAQKKDVLVEAFAAAHGLDAKRPMTLEDTDLTVTQGDV